MVINITGGSKSQRKYIPSIIEFCIDTMMPRMKDIQIDVRVKKLAGDAYGYCLADPEGDASRLDRPRHFELEIHNKMPLRRFLETICHEMVHVKQYARGELYESSRQSKHRWQGNWIRKDPDYWDCPWEIEAHGREAGLFIRWADKNKLGHLKWTHDD